MSQLSKKLLTGAISLSICAMSALFASESFAIIPQKTSGCPDHWASIQGFLSAPIQNYNGYAYFCMVPGGSSVIDGMVYSDGCIGVAANSGPIQIKFPLSQAYIDSPQYATYIQSVSSQCAAFDPNAGVEARFYDSTNYGGTLLTPLACDLVSGQESCSALKQ